jgi:hypothetical protein
MATIRNAIRLSLRLSLVSDAMTEEQYRGLLLHLRILIVLAGFIVGILWRSRGNICEAAWRFRSSILSGGITQII